MVDIEKSVLYDGEVKMTAKGREFTVKPLPLRYIANGEFQKSGLFFPQDKERPGYLQFYNVTDEKRRAELDKWMKLLLSHDGDSVSFEQVCEWDWDITDIGRWLDLVVQMSG